MGNLKKTIVNIGVGVVIGLVVGAGGTLFLNWTNRAKPIIIANSITFQGIENQEVSISKETKDLLDGISNDSNLNRAYTYKELDKLKAFFNREILSFVSQSEAHKEWVAKLTSKQGDSYVDKDAIYDSLFFSDSVASQFLLNYLRKNDVPFLREFYKQVSESEEQGVDLVHLQIDTEKQSLFYINENDMERVIGRFFTVNENDVNELMGLVSSYQLGKKENIMKIEDFLIEKLKEKYIEYREKIDFIEKDMKENQRVVIQATLMNNGNNPILINPYFLLNLETENEIRPLTLNTLKVNDELRYFLDNVYDYLESTKEIINIFDENSVSGDDAELKRKNIDHVTTFISVNPGESTSVELVSLSSVGELGDFYENVYNYGLVPFTIKGIDVTGKPIISETVYFGFDVSNLLIKEIESISNY